MEYAVTFATGKTMRVHAESEAAARAHAAEVVQAAKFRGVTAARTEAEYANAGEIATVALA